MDNEYYSVGLDMLSASELSIQKSIKNISKLTENGATSDKQRLVLEQLDAIFMAEAVRKKLLEKYRMSILGKFALTLSKDDRSDRLLVHDKTGFIDYEFKF
jgi:hypothetical protein